MRQGREEALEVFVQKGVAAHLLFELDQLARAGQFAVDEQPGDLEVCRVARQVFDRVAPVTQNPRVAIDVGDRAARRRRVDETLVERRESGLLGEAAEVYRVFAVDRGQHGELGRVPLVGERDG